MHSVGVLLTFLLLISQVPAEDQLRQTVQSYWQAMEKRDKYSALEYVLPESRNAFIQRTEFIFRDWTVEDIRPVEGEPKAHVVLSVERLMEQSGTFYRTRIRQSWVYQSNRWYLSVPQLSSRKIHELMYGLNRSANRVPGGEVRVLPDIVKMSFLNPVQRGTIVIQNGLDEPLQLMSLQVDKSLFEVEELPESVAPGSESTLYLRYLGNEEEKDRESEAVLVLKMGDKKREYPIRILYNHISERTKAFFGLTDEEAQQLKRGQKLTPKLPTPPGAGKAPPGIPEEVLESDSEGPPPGQ